MTALGLAQGIVRLAAYNPEWPQLFTAEKLRLQAAIGPHVLDIQHVGSTSIPGMNAKPIIDIAIAVASFEAAFVCVPPVEQLGYEYKGENGIPRRHYFSRGAPCTHHIHMVELSSSDWINQILFRDYLIRHPAAAGEYAALKQALARQYPTDRKVYTGQKAPVIERIIEQAKKEGRS
jgi:GrpB-like predicted nucleotidyltransferase (UPF0157 family)